MKTTPFIPGQAGITDAMQKLLQGQTQDNGLDISYSQGVDANGWANLFAHANISGVMLRVSATGVTPPAGSVNWTAANTKIPHNLGRIPIGWLVTFKSKTCDVFAGTTLADKQFVYLTITDDTADTNLFIF